MRCSLSFSPGSGLLPHAAGRTVITLAVDDWLLERLLTFDGGAEHLEDGGDGEPDDEAEVGAPPSRHSPAQKKTPGAPLLIPIQRPIPQDLGEPEALRLPPVEDRLDDIWRQAGERKETADVGVRDAVLFREIGDRFRAAALDPTAPAVPARPSVADNPLS